MGLQGYSVVIDPLHIKSATIGRDAMDTNYRLANTHPYGVYSLGAVPTVSTDSLFGKADCSDQIT